MEQRLIKSKPSGKLPIDELKRLIKIKNEVMSSGVCIDLVIIEGIAFMVRNSVSLVQLSALNYMVRESLYKEKIPFLIVAPTTLKRFCTGKGNCPKDLILLEVYKRWEESFDHNDLADAYGLAKIGELFLKKDIESDPDIPKFQKETIDLLKKQIKQLN